MANEMHTHSFSGVTTLNNGHTHRYSGVTTPALNVPGHVHYIIGTTVAHDGHKHSFKLQTGTGKSMKVAGGGHTHSFADGTQSADEHVHNMNGFTNVFK